MKSSNSRSRISRHGRPLLHAFLAAISVAATDTARAGEIDTVIVDDTNRSRSKPRSTAKLSPRTSYRRRSPLS